MLTCSKVLCAVDFSSGARDALEDAADLARRFGAQLTLVHVLDAPRAMGARPSVPPPELLEREARQLGRRLEGWRHEAERIAGAPVRTVIADGPPAAEIARLAESGDFDLVVTGTHGRHGVGRLLLGSVAERVVRDAPCPVLVARARPERD
jgi:nucleotide-binding universal stress UspA family protein